MLFVLCFWAFIIVFLCLPVLLPLVLVITVNKNWFSIDLPDQINWLLLLVKLHVMVLNII